MPKVNNANHFKCKNVFELKREIKENKKMNKSLDIKKLIGDLKRWKFFLKDEQAEEVFKAFKKAVEAGFWEFFTLYKTTTGRRRIYLFQPEGKEEKYIIKAYFPPKLWKKMKYLVRASRCKQEYLVSQKLSEMGFGVVPAMFFGYQRQAGFLPSSELVLELFCELDSFEEVWKKSEDRQKEELFKKLAELVFNLHSKGVLQRDFKPDSMLVKKAGEKVELILSDLERIKIYSHSLFSYQRIKNLGKIFDSFFKLRPSKELYGFLKEYIAYAGIKDAERFYQRVIKAGRRELLKSGERAKNWAKDTNELIERFIVDDKEVRLYRTINKQEIRSWLKKAEPDKQKELVINGKSIYFFPVSSAKKEMEKYFFLKALGIACQLVALAIDFKDRNKGWIGILSEQAPDIETALKESVLSKNQLYNLGRFIFWLDFLGIELGAEPEKNILFKKGDSADFIVARCDLVRIKKAGSGLTKRGDSKTIEKILNNLSLNDLLSTQILQGFASERRQVFSLSSEQ